MANSATNGNGKWLRWALGLILGGGVAALGVNFSLDMHQESAIAARLEKCDYDQDQQNIQGHLRELRDGQKELYRVLIQIRRDGNGHPASGAWKP